MNKRSELESLVARLEGGRVSRRVFVLRGLAVGLSVSSVGRLLNAGASKEGIATAEGETATDAADLGPIEKELHLYNWSDYIDWDTVASFEKEFGIRVIYDTYESNEEMVGGLQADSGGYDVIVPSGHLIPGLAAAGTIMPINRKYLSNEGNISPLFRKLPCDPDDMYSVPWQWGTTGIAYRTDRIKIPVNSWDVFHDRKYAGKLTMLDDGREVIGAELRRCGRGLGSSEPATLARAGGIDAKKNLKAYVSAPVKAQLVSGDVLISQLWSGDTAQAQAEQPSLAYVIPREGCTLWCDSMAILKSAPNKRAAHEWINYILRAEVGAAVSEATGYGTPNAAAAAVMRAPTPFPTEDELQRLEYPVDLDKDSSAWDEIWREIRIA